MIAHHFITLTQPWATLMAIGAKRIETRSWRTKFRGPIAIHAAKAFPGDCLRLCHDPEFFWPALHRGGVAYPEDLPRGQIIAVVELVDCFETEHIRDALEPAERAFGNYDDGRFGFLTRGARMLKKPVPFKGALGIRQIIGEPITEDMLV